MLRARSIPIVLALVAVSWLPARASAGEPFRYPEGKQGKASLRYVNGVPVLTVAGTPDEIGEQVGKLAAAPARKIIDYPEDLLNRFHAHFLWPWLVKEGNRLFGGFPADYRKELEGLVHGSGFDHDHVVAANTMFDLKKTFACSALLIDAGRSATGGPLFGRNLDYPSLGYVQDYSLVTVYKPQGKHAFVSVGFPGLVGCLSGMNDAGLSVAVLEVYGVKYPGEKFSASGLPYALCYRRILEECTTVDEAAKLLRTLPRITITNLAVCDRNGGAVFEVTPKRVVVRRPEKGVCSCTNHFCTEELRVPLSSIRQRSLTRFEALEKVREKETVGVEDVHDRLHAARQGDHTLQTMVFEPATLKLHLAIGKAPASAGELKTLGLAELLK